jgi:hypothetical protein
MITCIKFRPYEKNTLRGFADLRLDSGLILHECALHQRGGEEWVGLPSRSFTGNDGTTKWTPIVEVTKEAKASFQRQALDAIHAVAGNTKNAAATTQPKKPLRSDLNDALPW